MDTTDSTRSQTKFAAEAEEPQVNADQREGSATLELKQKKSVQVGETLNSGGREKEKEKGLTARVVLPVADPESDEDAEDAEEDTEAADEDLLVNFPDETEDIELLHSRLKTLDNLRLPRFAPYLKKLCLRQNFIFHLGPDSFHPLTNLEELDLYDNKLKHIGNALDTLGNLSVLDLSFNLLKHIPERLEALTSLKTIYFVQNKINKINNLVSCTKLTSLELGGNRIRKIEGLESLVNLEELWLGKNKITKLEGLGTLQKLRILSMQSNRITKLENLEELTGLEELYLSHNGVRQIEGLEKNIKLTTLDLGSNFIPAIENLSHLTNLEELWMSGNQIPNLLALEPELKHITTLTTLYLEANPCQTSEPTSYRRKIQLALPQLKQIDATYTRGAAGA